MRAPCTKAYGERSIERKRFRKASTAPPMPSSGNCSFPRRPPNMSSTCRPISRRDLPGVPSAATRDASDSLPDGTSRRSVPRKYSAIRALEVLGPAFLIWAARAAASPGSTFSAWEIACASSLSSRASSAISLASSGPTFFFARIFSGRATIAAVSGSPASSDMNICSLFLRVERPRRQSNSAATRNSVASSSPILSAAARAMKSLKSGIPRLWNCEA